MNNKPVVLKPVAYEHGEAMYDNADVNMVIMQSINNQTYFYNIRVKKMNDDIKKASESLDSAMEIFNSKLNKFVATQENITQQTDKISRALRESTQKMAEGLTRIEKQANFNNLERYITLLERANVALLSLAELEKNGKLNKISEALK